MSQISSAHLALQVTSTTHLSRAVLPGVRQYEQVTITGDGDEALPQQGQEHLHLTVTPASGQPLQIAEVYSHKHLFLQQGAQGQWVEVDTGSLPSAQGLVQALLPQQLDPAMVLALAQHLHDLGHETVAGQTLHHLSLSFDTAGLKLLLAASHPATPQEQQVLAALRQDLRVANGTLDLWIDDATSLIHRAELKGHIEASVKARGPAVQSGAQAMQPLTLNTTFDARVELSRFNQQVSIDVPTPATQVQLPALALT